jgi:16S rRNA (cytosine1402-N4)-methyltransferase
MLNEVLQYLGPKDGETYIDATFGAGGYTSAILAAANCNVIAIDQDPLAKEIAQKITGNFKFVEGNFGDMANLISEKVDGIIFDIGISSMQIDVAERGFSFSKDGPLDMRMSQHGMTAAEYLNTEDEAEIADIIFKYGEERDSRRIAKSIVAARPLTTTTQLAKLIGHPNSIQRTFQAIRIHINQELEVLEKGLEAALNLLKDGGRLIIVTFHSLEDRIVKLFFKKHSSPKEKTNKYDTKPEQKIFNSALELITKKAIMPLESELKTNPRARSAKLRAASKTPNNIGDSL